MKAQTIQPGTTPPPTPAEKLPPGTPAWITPELVRLTLKVWQRHYEKRLSVEDAVTLVLNAGHLFSVLDRE